MVLHFASVNIWDLVSSHVILRFFNYYMFMGTVINYSEKKGKKGKKKSNKFYKIEQIIKSNKL